MEKNNRKFSPSPAEKRGSGKNSFRKGSSEKNSFGKGSSGKNDFRKTDFEKADFTEGYFKKDVYRKDSTPGKGVAEAEADTGNEDFVIEGRNPVLEVLRSGRPIHRLFVQDGCLDGPVQTIVREAKKREVMLQFVSRRRLDQLSDTGRHQGVIAQAAAYEYAQVEDMLELARKKGEPPFLILLDGIEDPHNLGAIIRTANLAGAHGVIIPKHRAAGLTAVVAKASAGALNFTPVARVTNLSAAIEELKEQGLWFVCADMGGETMYTMNLTGPIGLVIGNEGEGVSRLVREKCDMVASIPVRGEINSLNASVAAGVLAYEIVRQRMGQKTENSLS